MSIFSHTLIITPKQLSTFGGSVMNRRNIEVVKHVTKKSIIFEIDSARPLPRLYKYTKYFTRNRGYIAELRKDDIAKIESIISKTQDIDSICINTSLWGVIGKKIKQLFPEIKVLFFFHNAEYQYVREIIKENGATLKLKLQYQNHRYAEEMALRYSDFRFVLSSRDNTYLQKLLPSINHVLPMSIEDVGTIKYQLNDSAPLRLLFFGSAFFANIHGIRWFAKNVMPAVKAHLIIAGYGMEKLKDELENEHITVLGKIDNIKELYQATDIVVSSMFYGSGMKTKTAEALMFGRPIIGTNEAFSGFDSIDCNKIGKCCNTSDEFIEFLNYIENNRGKLANYSLMSRKYYEQYYSISATKSLIESILKE